MWPRAKPPTELDRSAAVMTLSRTGFSPLDRNAILPLANRVSSRPQRFFAAAIMDDFKKTCHKGEHSALKVWRSSLFVILFLVAFAQAARAQQVPQTTASLAPQSRSKFAIDDFDGDSRPDLASVEAAQRDSRDARYQIRFQLTAGRLQTIGLTAPVGGLRLRSGDVNGDNYPDVVVTTFWTNQPVAVLLNDGLGNFSEAEPSRYPGAFTSSEVSVTCGCYAAINETAAIFQRYLPRHCEDQASKSSPPRVVGCFVGESFHFMTSACTDFCFGRAPPFVRPRS